MRTSEHRFYYLAGLALAQFACGGTTVSAFEYGHGMPGLAYQRGGMLLFESVNAAAGVQGLGARGQAHFWARTRTDGVTPNDPVYTPNVCNPTRQDAMGNDLPLGPIAAPPGVNFIDMGPNVTLTPVNGGDAVVLNQFAMGGVDNQGRVITTNVYGGNKQQAPWPFDTFKQNEHYTLSFQGPDPSVASSKVQALQKAGTDPQVFLPNRFQVTSPNIGTDAMVTVAANQDFKISFQPLETMDTTEHTPERTFPFIIISGLQMGKGHHAWFCPMNDGKVHNDFTVPAEIVSQMDPTGIIQMGQLTHLMGKLDANGQSLRMDLISVSCNTSAYQIQ